MTLTTKEAAARLDGSNYRNEGNPELFAEMKQAGLVAIFGASDDLVEMEGAISDEAGASTLLITRKGLFKERCDHEECPYEAALRAKAAKIEPLWCELRDTTWEEGKTHTVPWTYRTTIPHETFWVIDEDGPYCRGIVFALADVPAQAGDRVRHRKRGTSYTVISRDAPLRTFDARPFRDHDMMSIHEREEGGFFVIRASDQREFTRGELTRSARLQVSEDRLLKEGDMMTAYIGDDGRYSVRPTDEFEDGRFEALF